MSLNRYAAEYERWRSDPEGFWRDAAAALPWTRPFDSVIDDSRGAPPTWFAGGEINACRAALDIHIERGRGDEIALIYESAMTGARARYSFAEIRDQTARFAGGLISLGVARGDRVIIYMPMVPEAVIAMLACARIGAIHSVVFGGFASRELAARIDHAEPKVIVSASCGFEPGRTVNYKRLLDDAIALAAHKPHRCIILNRKEGPCALTAGQDVDFDALQRDASPAPCEPMNAADPLYIL